MRPPRKNSQRQTQSVSNLRYLTQNYSWYIQCWFNSKFRLLSFIFRPPATKNLFPWNIFTARYQKVTTSGCPWGPPFQFCYKCLRNLRWRHSWGLVQLSLWLQCPSRGDTFCSSLVCEEWPCNQFHTSVGIQVYSHTNCEILFERFLLVIGLPVV